MSQPSSPEPQNLDPAKPYGQFDSPLPSGSIAFDQSWEAAQHRLKKAEAAEAEGRHDDAEWYRYMAGLHVDALATTSGFGSEKVA